MFAIRVPLGVLAFLAVFLFTGAHAATVAAAARSPRKGSEVQGGMESRQFSVSGPVVAPADLHRCAKYGELPGVQGGADGGAARLLPAVLPRDAPPAGRV